MGKPVSLSFKEKSWLFKQNSANKDALRAAWILGCRAGVFTLFLPLKWFIAPILLL
jgi:hypothetical protein